MLPMATPQGAITALVFAANPSHPEYAGELPLVETAAVIASACGPLGTNRHYLEQLAAQLAALDMEDAYVEELLGQVQACGGQTRSAVLAGRRTAKPRQAPGA